jgi:hypothetical protein
LFSIFFNTSVSSFGGVSFADGSLGFSAGLDFSSLNLSLILLKPVDIESFSPSENLSNKLKNLSFVKIYILSCFKFINC